MSAEIGERSAVATPSSMSPSCGHAPLRRSHVLSLGCAVLTLAACGGMLDAGADQPHGLLPVDERNPIVICNDGVRDNWQGEYAVLLAGSSGPAIAGIIVNSSANQPDLLANVTGWRDFVAAARASGIRNIPDPTSSVGAPLSIPANGDLEATVPNRSEGAQLIIELSRRLSRAYRPLVIVTGGRLTDVADAYLIDRTVADRVVVVSSLGTISPPGGKMNAPNGDLDPWADAIVSMRLRYIQVSAYYDQLGDVPSSLLPSLPANPLGAWITAKQPNIYDTPISADQVSVIALGLPALVVEVNRVSPDAALPSAGAGAGPSLVPDPGGQDWLVIRTDAALASARFRELLLDPKTYGP
jgi:hypothetical protein